MESEYFEDAADEGSSNMGTAGKLLIMVGSLGVASIVGVYVHPHLLPLATEWVPPLWRAAQGWMTAPILFLLLNVVVGTLYMSSNMLSRRAAPPGEMAEGGGPPPTKANDRTLSPDQSNSGRRATPAPSRPAASTGLRARFEKSKTLTRLVRSKSEQIPPSSSKAAASGSASRLKKAGTFEATPRSVVVVADPPEDAAPPAGHEEVDKKAEAFISRFYHKVRLQRLDSLLRQRQQQQQEQGRQ